MNRIWQYWHYYELCFPIFAVSFLMILVNMKLYMSVDTWGLHLRVESQMAHLKQSWQYWHSFVAESLWKTSLECLLCWEWRSTFATSEILFCSEEQPSIFHEKYDCSVFTFTSFCSSLVLLTRALMQYTSFRKKCNIWVFPIWVFSLNWLNSTKRNYHEKSRYFLLW